jgi:hypothetical protein
VAFLLNRSWCRCPMPDALTAGRILDKDGCRRSKTQRRARSAPLNKQLQVRRNLFVSLRLIIDFIDLEHDSLASEMCSDQRKLIDIEVIRLFSLFSRFRRLRVCMFLELFQWYHFSFAHYQGDFKLIDGCSPERLGLSSMPFQTL